MRFALPLIAAAMAIAIWHWAALLLEPLDLVEFLFVARVCLILAGLGGAEILFRKVAP